MMRTMNVLTGKVVEIEEVAPSFPSEPTIEDYRIAIQAHVDAVAVGRLYDSAVSLASYATSTNPAWADEAAAFIAWRDEVWIFAYAELAKVTADPPQREQPTVEDFIAELPGIEWPDPE